MKLKKDTNDSLKDEYSQLFKFVLSCTVSVCMIWIFGYNLLNIFDNGYNRYTQIIHVNKSYTKDDVHILRVDILNEMNAKNGIDGTVDIINCDNHYDLKISAFCRKRKYKKVLLPIFNKNIGK